MLIPVDLSLQYDPEKRPKPEDFDTLQFIVENTPVNKTAVSKFVKKRLPEILSQVSN